MLKHFLTVQDIPYSQAFGVLARAEEMKKVDYRSDLLAGKTIVLIFEKASTRTRISFDVAIRHLGGQTIFMTPAESQLGRDEPIKDATRVLSRYVDGLVVRTFAHSNLEEMRLYSDIPVVNALSDSFHPCQIMSDILTMKEHGPGLDKTRVAWVGDGNNVAQSLINAAIYFPFELFLSFPEGYNPDTNVIDLALKSGAKIYMTHDPVEGVEDADFVYTDVWASMGQEAEQKKRERIFAPYQVTEELLKHAKPECKVLHCLPAHRGEEVSEEVLEGERSIVWDQAENRLHMQKAILEWVFGNVDYSIYPVPARINPIGHLGPHVAF
ncbi:ornithine carbamoyltransferase [Desulfovibrio inopinatus]|uniref:ornithine carbamoyltransferase n=1 Tax=Desulfovibrio inopinatus TaxID=102109 RepID=UPI0003F86A08|nr:ornithine carbamoyltransferase [Desulfovibrio inopinatus]